MCLIHCLKCKKVYETRRKFKYKSEETKCTNQKQTKITRSEPTASPTEFHNSAIRYYSDEVLQKSLNH